MEIAISSEVLDRIVAETSASPDLEVCGLLLGRDDAITAVLPCRNVAADPSRRFEIDPAALIAAHRRARAGELALLGHYHSHPTGSAAPSEQDALNAAADGAVWLIAAGDVVTAWMARPNGERHGRFDPVGLRRVPHDGTRASPDRED